MNFSEIGLAIVAFILGALLAIDIRAIRRRARQRREHEAMRHIVGGEQWWGRK